MRKRKYYRPVFFRADTLREAEQTFFSLDASGKFAQSREWQLERASEMWRFDDADEFVADYRNDIEALWLSFSIGGRYALTVSMHERWDVAVEVAAPTRAEIQRVFAVFETAVDSSRVSNVLGQRPTVFIGHGRSVQWRDLKDHLSDKHDLNVEAYEVGARAGHSIRDILDDMLLKSTFALLVLTAEDLAENGKARARQNVVHELGLFQGRLGFSRAIVLLEDGTDEFSTIDGIQQIRFAKGNIREAFGDVLATIRREFGSDTR